MTVCAPVDYDSYRHNVPMYVYGGCLFHVWGLNIDVDYVYMCVCFLVNIIVICILACILSQQKI